MKLFSIYTRTQLVAQNLLDVFCSLNTGYWTSKMNGSLLTSYHLTREINGPLLAQVKNGSLLTQFTNGDFLYLQPVPDLAYKQL